MSVTDSDRKAHEIAHGKRIALQAEKVWQRDTPAGKIRMEHRWTDLVRYFSLPAGAKVLELGAGTGTWTTLLARLPWQITSLELSEDLLALARQRLAATSVDFVAGDAEELSFGPQAFEAVCGLSILHHLDLDKAFAEVHRVLKTGGKFWFSEPNMLNPQILIQKNVPPIKKWLGDTPDETAFFRWPLKRRLERFGFEDVTVEPFDFLHPQIPVSWTTSLDRLGQRLERIPGVREIGGSLLIHGRKGASV